MPSFSVLLRHAFELFAQKRHEYKGLHPRADVGVESVEVSDETGNSNRLSGVIACDCCS